MITVGTAAFLLPLKLMEYYIRLKLSGKRLDKIILDQLTRSEQGGFPQKIGPAQERKGGPDSQTVGGMTKRRPPPLTLIH